MPVQYVDVESTSISLKDLLAIALQGTEIILTQNDMPLVRLLPGTFGNIPRILGLHPGIWMSQDFDDPLPDEFWSSESP